jgi:hypothetical protein
MNMKKLLILMAITLSPYLVFAQSTIGIIDIDLNEMYLPGDKIVANAQYIPADGDSDPIETTEWCLMPIDEHGETGDIFFREEMHGEPGEYGFPPTSAIGLVEGTHYQVIVIATDAAGTKKATGVGDFYYMQFSLTADDEFCCDGAISAVAGYGGPANISHRWVLSPCDAQGNTYPPTRFDSGIISGAPGSYVFPSIMGQPPLLCDQYYRIDIYFYDPASPLAPTIKSKVVKTTKVKLQTKKGYCCGQYITANAQFCGPETATHHTYTLTPSDQNGNVTGADVYLSLNLGAPDPGGHQIEAWNYTTCDSFYLLTVKVYNGGTLVGTNTHLIYMSPLPTPVITGPTSVCGTGTFCTNFILGNGNTYFWAQALNYGAAPIPGAGNTSCVTVPYPSTFAGVGVIVTNQYGCTNLLPVGFPVTNTYVDPGFSVITGTNGPGHYTATATRNVAMPNGATEKWSMVELDSNLNPLPNTLLYGANWGYDVNTGSYIANNFFAYHGNFNTSYNGGTQPAITGSASELMNGESYRIYRTVYAPGCPAASDTWVIDQGGMTGKSLSSTSAPTEEEITFNLFPNPSTGLINIQSTSEEPGVADVYSILGSKIKTVVLPGGASTYVLDLTENSTGIYLVTITVGNKTETKRIIKE